jgi:AraC-like DNA-binding protein
MERLADLVMFTSGSVEICSRHPLSESMSDFDPIVSTRRAASLNAHPIMNTNHRDAAIFAMSLFSASSFASAGPVSYVHRTSIPRLARHRVFASRDEAEVRSFLAARNFLVDFPADDRDALDVHINGIQLPDLFLGHSSYGRAISIEATGSGSDYWLQFPTHRRFEISVAQQRHLCDARHGAVLSPTCENRISTETGCGRLGLALTRDVMVRKLAALLGRPVTRPIEFAPSLDLQRGYGRTLARHIHAAVEDLEQVDSLLRSPAAGQSFEQFVVTALLLSHPHNFSDELERPARRPAARDVRRAIDYIEGHLTASITLEDIVEAAGVSGRVLFKHFRSSLGTSPMAYLRNARFRCVREALRRAQPGERVVDIASLWGFDHLGRFSIEYRRRFGEKPSLTRATAVSVQSQRGTCAIA